MAEKKKRILNIVPVVGKELGVPIKETLDKYVSPGFEADYRNVKYGGVTSIEGLYYMAVTVPYIVDGIIQAENEGCDAVPTLCFGTRGVSDARELVRLPVDGPAEDAVYIASMFGACRGIAAVGATCRLQLALP